MMMYITDLVIIGLQVGILIMIGRWIHSLLDIKREIIKNKYTSLREALKDGEED